MHPKYTKLYLSLKNRYYHFVNEQLPRLSFFYDALIEDPEIKILVAHPASFVTVSMLTVFYMLSIIFTWELWSWWLSILKLNTTHSYSCDKRHEFLHLCIISEFFQVYANWRKTYCIPRGWSSWEDYSWTSVECGSFDVYMSAEIPPAKTKGNIEETGLDCCLCSLRIL